MDMPLIIQFTTQFMEVFKVEYLKFETNLKCLHVQLHYQLVSSSLTNCGAQLPYQLWCPALLLTAVSSSITNCDVQLTTVVSSSITKCGVQFPYQLWCPAPLPTGVQLYYQLVSSSIINCGVQLPTMVSSSLTNCGVF